MKKLLVVLLGALVLMSAAAFAQDSYYVDYYAHNGPPQAGVAQELRIINVGVNGNPLTVPVGDICAQIYVFDNNQEMVACCGCNITPNGLASAWVNTQLTNNPVTKVIPNFGVIKVALMANNTGAACNPTAPLLGANTSFGEVWGTHINAPTAAGGTAYFTETEKLSSPLSAAEETFLPTACSFARYLGSGFGTCSCTNPGQ